jgi:hypothetical protein
MVWSDIVKESWPDLVIMGVGPHILSDFTINFRIVREEIRATFLREFFNVTLIWHTHMGGGCSRSPLVAMPHLVPGYWQSLVDDGMNLYNYLWMELEEETTVDFWTGVPNVHVLDLRPLWMRPDAMVDSFSKQPANCVHVCIPGPHLLSVKLLLHLLLHKL